MTVKETLIEAGRYNQIISILEEILNTKQLTFPVDCYSHEGKAKYDVYGPNVRTEARTLMDAINNDRISQFDSSNFDNLYQYIHSNTDILLHNYAVHVAHGYASENAGDIDKIRQWCILDNLIICLDPVQDEEEDPTDWNIPEGWKAGNENTEENIDRSVSTGTNSYSSVKEALIASGRYDHIMTILKNILFGQEEEFKVECYKDKAGKAAYSIDGSKLRTEAGRLIVAIEDDIVLSIIMEEIENLQLYVHSYTNTLLQDYAIHQLSGLENTKEEDQIRQWYILNNLITSICVDDIEDYNDFYWDVPEAWRNNKGE